MVVNWKVTYSSESWIMTFRNKSATNATKMRFFRKIDKKTITEKTRSEMMSLRKIWE